MGYEGQDFADIAGSVSPAFIDALYRRYQAAPDSVEPGWRAFFDGLEGATTGPSWASDRWPLAATDDLTAALDPTQMEPAPRPAKGGKPAATTPSRDDVIKAAGDAIRAQMLIRTYRVRGHLAANLDPLGLSGTRDLPEDLRTDYHGFTDADIDRPVYLGGSLGMQWGTIREVVDTLRANYCGSVGLEYMHIADVEERRFLQDRMEGKDKAIEFTAQGKKAILNKVIEAEQWEKFLGRKYVGTKRFGLDGGESMIPALESVIKYGGAAGVNEIVIGMSHRGRLNVLANVMAKPLRVIFHEFAGGSANPDQIGGSGDVKYHLGTSTDREFDGKKVHMSLVANPSHLEAADPVVLGKVRAIQTIAGDLDDHCQALPVLIHGDAAFAGQGIVWECFGFSGIRGYNTGGCIHFVVNNQIGFTTSPQFARSSPYPSDVAKGVQAPIFHVNGDDPEAVTFATKMAIEYRQKFHRDVVIDMWCYRRFGHNEGDEPSFTQPLMYKAIKGHEPVSAIYGQRLMAEGVVDQAWLDDNVAQFTARLEGEFEAGSSYQAQQGGLVFGPLVRAARARRWRGRAPQRRYRDRPQAVRRDRPHADDGAGRPGDPQDACPRDRRQARDVHVGREFRLGDRRGAGVRIAALEQGYGRSPFGSGRRDAARSASAMQCGSIRKASANMCRCGMSNTAISRSSIHRSANTACWALNMAMRWPTPRHWCCGKRSSAISPMARRS